MESIYVLYGIHIWEKPHCMESIYTIFSSLTELYFFVLLLKRKWTLKKQKTFKKGEKVRTKIVKFRVDICEFDFIETETKKYKNRSEFLRECVQKQMPPAQNKKILIALEMCRMEVRKIGVNINQIVKDYNSGFYSSTEKEALFLHLEELNMKFEQLLKRIE